MNKTNYGYDAKELGLEVVGYSGLNEVLCKCPNPDHNDSNPSASFNTDSGLLYCFSCSYSTNAYKLAKESGVVFEKKPLPYVKPDKEKLWQEFYKLKPAMDNKYLQSRGLTNKEVAQFNIREFKDGVVFLSPDSEFCQIRHYKKTPKYLTFGERILFDKSRIKLFNPEQPIYLTEGIFGMIRGYQSGLQTLAVIGAMIKENTLTPILNWRKIIGVFDNDLAGSIAAIRLLKFLPQAKIVLGATADEMSIQEWLEIHQNYLTTNNVLDIIKLSKEPNKLRRYA